MFIGRKKELDYLDKVYASNTKEFGVIYGRRRIGKTSLIDKFIEDKPHLFFQAKEDSAYGNLRAFSYELNKLLNLPANFIFSSWQEALDALSNHFSNRRYVFVIDEYPYVTKQDKSFSSLMQDFFDHSSNNLMLIISGSDVSFLQKEIKNKKSPLYKRKTFEMNIGKLPLEEALLFLKDYDNETKCSFLSMMSTIPYYLSAINTQNSFEEEMKRLVINEYGIFFNLPDNVLSKSSKPDIYNSILFAIANRKITISDISSFIGEDTGKVSKYMITLLNSEIVERKTSFKGNKKNNYYIISDPLLRFWYKAVFPNQARISINSNLVFEELKPTIREFVDIGFEEVALLYLNKLNRLGKLGDIYPEIQTFKADNTKLGRSVEIDGLSQINNKLLVVECKNRNKRFTLDMLKHLQESASIFNSKLTRYYYLFSKSGFEDNLSADEYVHLIDLETLFEE